MGFLSDLFCSPQKCPACKGEGHELYFSEAQGELDTTTCSICNGTGKVKFVKEKNGTKYYRPYPDD